MNNDNQDKGGQGINPAWKPLLDSLPESLHGLITPHLREWDKGVQKRFEDIHAQYEELKPFQKFVENNIDPEYVVQAVQFAAQLEQDPKKTVDQINDVWKLGYLSQEEAQKLGQQSAGNSTDDDDFLNDSEDILKHPKVKAMYESLNKLQHEFETTREREERERREQEEFEEFEEYMDKLEQKYEDAKQPFDRDYVTALISQGWDAEEAVKKYQTLLISNNVTSDNPPPSGGDNGDNEPPVVMGSSGSTGAGVDNGAINFGSLSKDDLNKTVEQMLAQAQESGQ